VCYKARHPGYFVRVSKMTSTFIDYYETLGLNRTATKDEIKTAYRKAARKHHPDLHPQSEKAAAEEKFKKINEAYEVLNDSEKREKYDRLGESWESGQEWQPAPDWSGQNNNQWDTRNASSFSDFFESMFGDVKTGGFQGRGGQQRNTRGQNLESEIEVTLEEAYRGGQKAFQFSLKSICPTCGGTGAVNQKTCWSCGGTGYISTPKTLDIKIPVGIKDGSTIRLRGQGGEGSGGGKRGDLLLTVKVKSHFTFTLKGNHLETSKKIRPEQAVLGSQISVATIDGEVLTTVPPMSHNGQKLRLRSKGWPEKDGTRGDQYVELLIDIPASLNQEEKLIYQKLMDLGKEVPVS